MIPPPLPEPAQKSRYFGLTLIQHAPYSYGLARPFVLSAAQKTIANHQFFKGKQWHSQT